jgi:transcription elongation factor Elf1
MKDEYGRKLQCPQCGSLKIAHIKDNDDLPSGIVYCKNCGKIGNPSMFRALPKIDENPSRRDSELEDPNELIVSYSNSTAYNC